MATRLRGFPPIGSDNPRLLILGSFPSVRSLETGEYYGHERNHFWSLMASLMGFDPSAAYEERLGLLASAGIAVWDLIASCDREGSLDAAIRGEELNPLAGFIASRPALTGLGLNGGKAASAFALAFAPELRVSLLRIGGPLSWIPPFEAERSISVTRLPSTSPVPTARYRSAQDKAPAWRAFLLPQLAPRAMRE